MTDYHRTNINLYRSDFEYLLAKFGYGWTQEIREVVHRYVESLRTYNQFRPEPPIDLDKLLQEQDQ
jgi:hypothetical protein